MSKSNKNHTREQYQYQRQIRHFKDEERRLRGQIAHLKDENRRLQRQIKQHETRTDPIPDGLRVKTLAENSSRNGIRREFLRRGNFAVLYAGRSYPSYLYKKLKNTTAWSAGNKVMSYSRRFKLLNNLFRAATMITVWIQTSAILLVVYTAAAILIPVLFVFFMLVSAISITQYHKNNKKIKNIIGGRRVCVLFAEDKDALKEGAYFYEMTARLARDNPVIIVSPYFWRPIGLGSHKQYLCARRETENIFIIRKHYYFSLNKNVLRGGGIYIY